ncbi:family 16 glycosylhydrolase [Lichenicoccus roseus]|uniref:Glycosyl hydrolase family protein n=1 Tax=Lichenicoccus roseus TaxID=2683649 RepID=A0A5R9J496_9PROT|nr:family 16 glycosylhydrolase [Lichenicoccus roseus]TLU72445.1 glycosyl hydrolase family protein [Lichenicoccus roseus]
MTLNTSNFSLVFDDQFGSDPTYNAALWPDHWGNPDQSSFGNGTLTMTGYQSQGWSPVGMMQTAAGAQAGEGYGLYQFTGYGNPNQGAGVAVLMWRADNQFLPSSAPGVDSEIDLLESLDGSKTVLSTEHYYDASWQNDDGQIYHTIDVDPSVQHTYSVNWERGSLTYYIDGQEYWQDTSHVPLDAADGGCNEVLGAEVQGGSFNTSTSTVQLHIVSLSYSAPSGAAASMPTISLTQPGTVQEPGKGAGVTVTETVTTSNQTGTIYLEVLTQTGATESAFIPLTLSGGRVSAAVHMANPGDLIRVVDAEATADTAGVTITDAPVGVVTLGGASQSYAAPAGATVQAGSGADTVEAAAGDVTVLGGAGNITFINGSGASDVTAGTGAATLFGGAGGGRYAGGSGGHNVLVAQGAGGSNTTLAGAVGGDVLFGSNTGNNVMVAGAGSETLVGGTGATTMLGGAGSTVMFTGNGSSSVVGGSAGGDTIIGAAGALQVTAQHGDAVFGGTGALSLTGSTDGADSVIGGSGALSVTGRGANMLVAASSTRSDIATGNGASLIFANAGATTVSGGGGSLQVLLGAGTATIDEGSGAATFQVVDGQAGGTDVLHGFRPGPDSVNLYGYNASQVSVSVANGSTLIALADGTRIQLVGVTDPGAGLHV